MQIRDMLPWARRADRPDAPPAARTERAHPMAELERDMNRLFGDFWNRFEESFGGPDAPWRGNIAQADVVETEDGVEVTVELPGMELENLDVALTGDALTIKGEKKVESTENKKGYYVSERSYGTVQRTIPLPPGVDTAKAEATFKNGVLTVKLPQSAEERSQAKRVDIKSA